MNTVDEQGSLALQRVEEAWATEGDLERELYDARRETESLIRAALDYGHSVEMIRAVTGRSRAWVYAVRDGRRRP